MKKTDYSKISKVYDNNSGRHVQPVEEMIRTCLSRVAGELRILDLACGTGNFLRAQAMYYNDPRITWHGFDNSPEMISKAKEKNPTVSFKTGDADVLPYSAGYFDIVHCSFAFHHFGRKQASIDEVSRVLKVGGCFILRNIIPELMQTNWVYNFFPKAKSIDNERFWTEKKLLNVLKKKFAHPFAVVSIIKNEFSAASLLELAKNRDMSQLNLINDDHFNAGLKKLEVQAKKSQRYFSELATLRFVGLKPAGSPAREEK